MINPIHLIRRRVPKGGSEEKLWHFQADNGRLYEIRQFGREKFLLGEFRPNGMLAKVVKGDTCYERSQIILDVLDKVSPNKLMPHLEQLGINQDEVVKVGAGINISSIYYASLEAACDAIQSSINNDSWLVTVTEPTAEDLQNQRKQALVDQVAFLTECKNRLESARKLPGLFSGCHSMLEDLSAESRQQILSYLNRPSQEAWLKIRNMLITCEQTLWAAWSRYDLSAPRAGNVGYPGADTLKRSIRMAIADWEAEVSTRLAKALEAHSQVPARLEVAHAVR